MIKKIFLIACFYGITQQGYSQLTKLPEKEHLVLNFTYDTWLDAPGKVKETLFSRGFSMLFVYDYQINEGPFSIGIGGGLMSHNVYSNAQIVERNEYRDTTLTYVTNIEALGEDSYVRNKSVATYANIPLELRYRSKTNDKGHSWKLAVGAKIGTLLQFHTKLVDNNKDKFKEYNYTHLNSLHYGITFRAGYGKVGLTAYYGLSTLFEEDKSISLTPFSIGVSLSPF